MKQFLPLFLIFTLSIGFAQEHQKVDFSELDRSGMQTNLLLTDVKPFTVLVDNERTHFSMYNFSESYKELAKSDPLNRFPNATQLNQELQPIIYNTTIPIGIIHTQYELVSKDAYDQGWVSIENNKMVKKANHDIFDVYTQTIIAPLAKRKKGLNTTFKVDPNLFVNTTDNSIIQIEVNFGNGNGFQTLTQGQEVTIKYTSKGEKKLNFRIHFENGEVVERASTLKLEYSNDDLEELFGLEVDSLISSYVPDLSIYGDSSTAPGQCEYQVFLSPDSVLDKPIFVVDGFDPGDSRGILSVYNMLTYIDSTGDTLNMGDYVREEAGYDIVVVNFPNYINSNGEVIEGGADYIERNALSLVSVIEEINSQKVGNAQNTLIGPSMGGLITRYALRYMEMNNLDHDSRLWLSFDSPHNGANVAMAVQYVFNYLAYGYPDIDELKAAVNGMLRSKAAQQMLVDHLDAHGSGQPLTPHGAPGYHDEFQHRLDSIGFPQNTRNVSMTNGSGVGHIFDDINGNAVYPGFNVMDGNIDAGTVLLMNTRLKLKAKFMPYAGQTSEIVNAKAQTQALFWITVDTYTADAKQNSSSDGVDTAPGGLFDILGLLDDFEMDPDYADLLQNALAIVKAGVFNFIPVTSSMALYNQPDYYHQINLGAGDTPWDDTLITNSETPFVNWYMPEENQAHVKLTPENVGFALCEIIKPEYELTLTSPSAIEVCQDQSFNTNMDFNVTLGCFQIAHFEVTGNPSGSIANLNHNELTQDGTLTLHCESFPPGDYTLLVTPNGETDKAVEITVTVNENIPDLTGTTAYSLDGEATYNLSDSVIVENGDNINLKLALDPSIGTVEWFDPSGISRGSHPFIEDIQYGSVEMGTWTVEITSNSNCNIFNAPTTLEFEVIVLSPLSITEYGMDNIMLYPNPSKGIFTISGLSYKESIQIKIIDNNGKTVKDKTYASDAEITVDMRDLTKGTYQIIIETENNKYLKKMIKL